MIQRLGKLERAALCRRCEHGIPIIYHVQSKRYMHEGPGLSVDTCEAEEVERRRSICGFIVDNYTSEICGGPTPCKEHSLTGSHGRREMKTCTR